MIKREQAEEKFLKVCITLESERELRAVVGALGRMSGHDYEEAIKQQGWSDDYHKLGKTGDKLYAELLCFVGENK